MLKIKNSKNKFCICCNSRLKKKVINLPKFPVTEFYISSDEKINYNFLVNQAYFYCDSCMHMSIRNILDPNFIYNNYTTISSQSRGAFICLKNFYKFFKKKKKSNQFINRGGGVRIIDIGGNDSTFLEFFKVKNRVNIDPNAYSKDRKIKIYRNFFDKIDFSRFRSKNSNIFFCSHTLEHLEKPQDLIKNIANNMKDRDELYLQFPSLERLIFMRRFDQLCHQHLNFFSILSINRLLNLNNLYINRYEYDDSHFGTLRILATKINNNKKITNPNLNSEVIKKSFKNFTYRCKIFNKNKLKNIKNSQGFGAGILTPVLAYFYPNLKKLKYIYDDNPKKFSTKFISMNPIIENSKFINKDKEVIVTSTSTNFAPRDIIKRLLKLGCKKIIIPTTSSAH